MKEALIVFAASLIFVFIANLVGDSQLIFSSKIVLGIAFLTLMYMVLGAYEHMLKMIWNVDTSKRRD